MGEDKAEMRLGSHTLLETAVGKLRAITDEVVVVGQREMVPGGVRAIRDLRSGCGPLGGMEAALEDLRETEAAVFLPVDMPMIPRALLQGMVELWAASGARACFAEVDGRVQPLLSLMRKSMLPMVSGALGRGDYRVRPVLEGNDAEGRCKLDIVRIVIRTAESSKVWPRWEPSPAEWATRKLWFANLNTPEEFSQATLRT